MCRLYGFHSTVPRKVECELIQSQNSLIVQSRRDEHGNSNPDGWGLVTYTNSLPHADRQKRPAFDGEDFRWAAAKAYSRTVMAHVRRATIGAVVPENTHPFVFDRFAFSHNGTIDGFPVLKDRILSEIEPALRSHIQGSTDSEHFFYLLLTRHMKNGTPMVKTLADCCNLVAGWSATEAPSAEFALNAIWTDGRRFVASKLGRSLWYVNRERVHWCEVCGSQHAIIEDRDEYHAVVVASERITSNEDWTPVPAGSVVEIGADFAVRVSGM
jgi:glutamine amidotransferase